MILKLVFCLLMCFGAADGSTTAKPAAESYQWVLWRQRCEQSTAECHRALTGRGLLETHTRHGPSQQLQGCSGLRVVLIASWQPQEMHTDISAASCCLRPWSQHTWDHPKDENLHTPAGKITVPFPAKCKKLNLMGIWFEPQATNTNHV